MWMKTLSAVSMSALLVAGTAQAQVQFQPSAALLERLSLATASADLVPSAAPEPTASTHGTTLFGLPMNEGPIDRIARGVIAGTLIGLGAYGLASGHFSGVASGVLLAVSVIPAATAAAGYCPLYQLFGLDYSF